MPSHDRDLVDVLLRHRLHRHFDRRIRGDGDQPVARRHRSATRSDGHSDWGVDRRSVSVMMPSSTPCWTTGTPRSCAR